MLRAVSSSLLKPASTLHNRDVLMPDLSVEVLKTQTRWQAGKEDILGM